ncbi:MAG: class I SAM-dependent methyltransferase [Lachnospiraceae bacterium]|nr:class I SAM-dependent methyltransferase [Lachnospiraceae bacterium]
MKPISNRLEALCSMVTPGYKLADIGCDHGFLSIALVERGICPSAIAMDLRPGPLSHAVENIAHEGLSNRIETRLSDGLDKLSIGEAESIVIAGMGGRLLIHILEAGDTIAKAAQELILQPQSEIPLVRHYLVEQGYQLLAEDMLCEDGKYYPMMKVAPAATDRGEILAERDADYLYGKMLLRNAHPVLREYLQWELRIKEEIRSKLPTDMATSTRMAEVNEAIASLQATIAEMDCL